MKHAPREADVSNQNFAAMFRHNSIADAQTQASSLANRFRGVERIEHPGNFLHSGSIVDELDDQAVRIRILRRSHPQFAVGLHSQDRVDRIVQDVQEHLLQLMRIGRNLRQIFRRIHDAL